MGDTPHLLVNGKEYAIPDTFTLGELADIEKITGQGYDLAQGGILGTLAMIYVAVHREDASVTIDDIRALNPEDFEFKGDSAPAPLSVPDSGSGPSENEPPGSSDGSTGSEFSPDSLLNDTGDQTSVTNAMSPSVISPA